MSQLTVTIEGWRDGQPIPREFAFCVPADPGPVSMGSNRSPAIRWTMGPEGTHSYAIICVDPDVPSKPDDVNQPGRTVPAALPRVDFYHWVLVDIPVTTHDLSAGADSDGITAGGKDPGPTACGLRGINSYTDWFANDTDMRGSYGGYDGPCPPWNDALIHRYIFTVYALDVATLGLTSRFGGQDALAAMQGHILAQGSYMGTYTLNKDLL